MGRIVRKMRVRNGCHRRCRVTPPFVCEKSGGANGEDMGLIEDTMCLRLRLIVAFRDY